MEIEKVSVPNMSELAIVNLGGTAEITFVPFIGDGGFLFFAKRIFLLKGVL